MLTGRATALKAFAFVNWVPTQEVAGFNRDETCTGATTQPPDSPAF